MSPYYQSAQCSPFIYSTVDPTISLVAPRHLNGIEIAITPVCDEFAERITSLGDTERGASWTINLGSRHLGFDLSGDRSTPVLVSRYISAGSIEEITATTLGNNAAQGRFWKRSPERMLGCAAGLNASHASVIFPCRTSRIRD